MDLALRRDRLRDELAELQESLDRAAAQEDRDNLHADALAAMRTYQVKETAEGYVRSLRAHFEDRRTDVTKEEAK